MNNSILIFSEKNGARLKYILNIIFRDVFGIQYSITQNKEEFRNCNHSKINYSSREFEKQDVKINPSSILFEYGVKDHHIEVHNHNDFQKIFFKSSGSIPFDIFSASFWLLSRYEEYLPFKPDRLNRYEVKNSLAWQYNFIETPLVNLWLNEFKNFLIKKFPELKFKKHSFSFISTIDIDNAYKYAYKGIMRTLGGYTKSFISGNKSEIKERTQVLTNKKNDPFDSYSFLLDTQKKFEIRTLFFFLLGDYGVNDKNHSAINKNFQALIKQITDYCDAGIHPSYKSNSGLNQLKIEINRLANITHREVLNSRQHFAILNFPGTYQALLQAGIQNDFSMDYGNCNGFRASFCYPYKWYDLDSEQETALVIHPFCIIETSIKYNNNATSLNALGFIRPVIDEVKKYNGELISTFHNDTLGENTEWEGWRQVYIDFIKEVLA